MTDGSTDRQVNTDVRMLARAHKITLTFAYARGDKNLGSVYFSVCFRLRLLSGCIEHGEEGCEVFVSAVHPAAGGWGI